MHLPHVWAKNPSVPFPCDTALESVVPINLAVQQLVLLEGEMVEERLRADRAGESLFFLRPAVDLGVGGQPLGRPESLAAMGASVASLVRVDVEVVLEGQKVVEVPLARGAVVEACRMGLLVVKQTTRMTVRPLTAMTLVRLVLQQFALRTVPSFLSLMPS